MTRKYKATFVFSILLLASCGSPAQDLAAICEEIEAAEKLNLSADRKAIHIALRLDDRLETNDIRDAWGAVSHAPANQRYQLMQNAAREVGVPNWRCPAMQPAD